MKHFESSLQNACQVLEERGDDYSNDVGASTTQVCHNETGICEENGEVKSMRRVPATFNLVGIRSLISPTLLYALAAAGWKDEFVIVDSTFPAESYVDMKKIIRLDGMPILPLVKEILNLWQLDREKPLALLFKDKVLQIWQPTNYPTKPSNQSA